LFKILHIATHNSGVAGIAASHLHQGLLAEGIDSSLLVLNKKETKVPAVMEYAPKFQNSLFQKMSYRLGFPRTQAQRHFKRTRLVHGKTVEMFSAPQTDYDILSHPLYR
jgi:hypothetical protein